MNNQASFWRQFADEHQAKQAVNPFTDSDATKQRPQRSKEEEGYGTPKEGTLTEYRGKKAGQQISGEVVELCNHIAQLGDGHADGTYTITFGTLFEAYTVISNKVVGMLLRAKKQKLLWFEGEMLFQRRDDDVVITLYKIPEEGECEAHCLKWLKPR